MDFQNSFTAKKELSFLQNSYNTSHHTFIVLPHYLAKVRSCDKSDTKGFEQAMPVFISPDLLPPNSPDFNHVD